MDDATVGPVPFASEANVENLAGKQTLDRMIIVSSLG